MKILNSWEGITAIRVSVSRAQINWFWFYLLEGQQNFTKKIRVTLKEYKTSKAIFIHGNKGQLVHELSL